MKKNKVSMQEIKKYKYKYLFLLTIILLGFISGIVFSNILSYNDHKEIGEVVNVYFEGLKENKEINYLANFFNSLKVNFLYFFVLIIFSFSIIGLFLNPFILYFKSFILGFSLGFIISLYSYSGILLGILYIFPHQILNMIVYLLISFYGMKLSANLFRYLFFHKTFNFQAFLHKYNKILLLSALILIFSTLYETFLADFVIKLFTFLLK